MASSAASNSSSTGSEKVQRSRSHLSLTKSAPLDKLDFDKLDLSTPVTMWEELVTASLETEQDKEQRVKARETMKIESDNEEILFVQQCRLTFLMRVAKHVDYDEGVERSPEFYKEIAKEVLRKWSHKHKVRIDGVDIGQDIKMNSSACPDHLLNENWFRKSQYGWTSEPCEHQRPELRGFDVFGCPDHDRTYLAWSGKYCVCVGDNFLDIILRSLSVFVEHRKKDPKTLSDQAEAQAQAPAQLQVRLT